MYENSDRHYLTRKTPVVVRVDGRAFHRITKHMAKPFDKPFMAQMVLAAEGVMREAMGSVLAYVQSDEASFLLMDTAKVDTDAWLEYRQDKVVSLSASIMTMEFNNLSEDWSMAAPAMFDARAFNVPEHDVVNYFLHRAQDWSRNSIQMLARAHFSHKQLYKCDRALMLRMLRNKDIEWEDLPDRAKYGMFIYRRVAPMERDDEIIYRRRLHRRADVPATYSDINYVLNEALKGYQREELDE